MEIAFVVLHYCQVGVTIDCITSLLNLEGESQIVVVDNASPDESGKQLEERYKLIENVHVILNDKNIGFASANNIGYAYAKKHLGAELIVVINNDTVIKDKEFAKKLASSPLLQKYHIIAPDIINKQGLHQNPKANQPPKFAEIVKNYKKAKLNYFIYSIPILGDIKAMLASSPKFNNSSKGEFCEMIVPHGAAVIYTPLWVENEEFAFYPGTFMYVEETLLYYYVKYRHYMIAYSPEFEIFHLEDISTKSRYSNKRKRGLFQLKHAIESHRVLIKYIQDNGLENVIC